MAKRPDSAAVPTRKPVEIILDEAETDTLRPIGGSKSDRFNNTLIDAMVKTAWLQPGIADEDRRRLMFVAVKGLQAFKPTDEIEGMIATQAMAAHHASMECSRRAMVPDQPFEAAQGFRKAAANASRIFIELLSALDRRRGKGGQQVVRVEHVHVHPGANAVVGNIAIPAIGGGGMQAKARENPVHRLPDWRTTLPLAQSCPRCGAKTRSGSSCRSPAMKNHKCRMHGGSSTGPKTAEGLKRIRAARTIHGRYSSEMTELRRMVAVLRREARRAIEAV
jgi:hypothetical protein